MSKREPPPPSIASRFLSAHKEHTAMAVTIWGTIGLIGTIFASGASFSSLIITRPEALALHEKQEVEIHLVKGMADYLLDARIANLNGELGAIHERIRLGRATQFDLSRKKDLEEELAALRKAKAGK